MLLLNKADIVASACSKISEGDIASAATLIADCYPFSPAQKSPRKYTCRQMISVFQRDGFVDRYRGTKLVFPPVLRLLSHYLPVAFPYHKNGKLSEGHIAYWELFPTIDHVYPVARGGTDSEENWVTCSMLSNSIKSNWTLEELQWHLLPPGNLADWDGLLGWFIEQVVKDPAVLNNPYVARWHAGLSATTSPRFQ